MAFDITLRDNGTNTFDINLSADIVKRTHLIIWLEDDLAA
jgi:hypothetical protein